MGGKPRTPALMKDGLGRASVLRLARNLAIGQREFAAEAFVRDACRGLEALELKARVAHVAQAIAAHLPTDFPKALLGIRKSLEHWDRGPESDSLRGFASWPVFVFIEHTGHAHPSMALAALRDLTHLFTSEFSIRPFLQAHPKMALQAIAQWTSHPSGQVRRLASEGIRPRLPWAPRLPDFQANPEAVIKILEMLKDDESEYVRRSVGNCLADVAVDHPERVIDVCTAWMKGASAERRWIVRRATRNLIKSGQPGVWKLHGYAENPKLRVENLRVTPTQVSLNQPFALNFALHSESVRDQKLVVDFVVHHVKASGLRSAKVFKLGELDLGAGAVVHFEKRHVFRTITTRTYYSGAHHIEIQVNGRRHCKAAVDLRID